MKNRTVPFYSETPTSFERLVALCIDYAFICAIGILMMIISGIIFGFFAVSLGLSKERVETSIIPAMATLFFIFVFVYYSHIFKKRGQTLGEKIMKIIILPSYGERIGIHGGLFRFISLFPPCTLANFIFVKDSLTETVLDHLTTTHTVKIDGTKP